MAIQTLGLTQPEKRSGLLENPAVPLSAAADWFLLGGGAETEAADLIAYQWHSWWLSGDGLGSGFLAGFSHDSASVAERLIALEQRR